jgi:hypothetical protein
MTRWHSAILDIKTNHTTECDVLSPGLNPVGKLLRPEVRTRNGHGGGTVQDVVGI